MSSRRKQKERPNPFDRLDTAVMERFPGVHCETSYSIFSMRHVTSWRKAGTDDENLKPAQAKLVREYVSGFMEGYEHAVEQSP